MASREVGQEEERTNLAVQEERPSLAARNGPPQVVRARQRQELQGYLQSMDPTNVSDVIGQYEPSSGRLFVRYRRRARSSEHANQYTTRDSVGLKEDFSVDAEREQAQEHEQDFQWSVDKVALDWTRADTVCNNTMNKPTNEDVAGRRQGNE